MAFRPKILAVDDEEFNRDILSEHLSEAGYEVILAEDGERGIALLEVHHDIDVIILDRMMPNMNGMEMLKLLKQNDHWKTIPVIMQTAAASSLQVAEGIAAGVYYYLAKPYDERVLLSITRAAITSQESQRMLVDEVQKKKKMMGLMEHGRFRFRTLQETNELSYFIASCFPDPATVVQGLNELMVNAVEHGNLGITYREKSDLLNTGEFQKEIGRRLILPENKNKFAFLEYRDLPDAYMITIGDEGPGFDWHNYLDFSSERALDPNGRGIAIAKSLAFSSLEYQGSGNRVVCKVAKV